MTAEAIQAESVCRGVGPREGRSAGASAAIAGKKPPTPPADATGCVPTGGGGGGGPQP
jgi:hypothetical protein